MSLVEHNVCVACLKDDKEDLFLCDRCRSPHHAGCAHLSSAEVSVLKTTDRKLYFLCAGCINANNKIDDLVKMMLEMRQETRQEIASLKTALLRNVPPSLPMTNTGNESLIAARQLRLIWSRVPESTTNDADERRHVDSKVLQSQGITEDSVSTENFEVATESEELPSNTIIKDEIMLPVGEMIVNNHERVSNLSINNAMDTSNLLGPNPSNPTIQEVVVLDADEGMVKSEERVCNEIPGLSNITSSQSPKIEVPGTNDSEIIINGNLDQQGSSSASTHSQNSTHHTHSHNGDKPFQCAVCEKSYTRKSYLISHIRLHSGEESFKCDLCGRAFTRVHELKMHFRTHSEKRPFKCTLCRKAFKYKSYLKIHFRSHSETISFKCVICEKSFTTKSYLNLHERFHTGEIPFKCAVCGQGFRTRTHMNEHLMLHTGEKPFKCAVCKKAFTKSTHLTAHIRTHTGEKPFICDVCGNAFATKGQLTRHRRIHWKTIQMQ